MAPPFLLTACLTLVGFGAMWGVMTNRQDAADRQRVEDRAQIQAVQADATALRVRVALVETEQTGAKRLLDTEVAGLRREVERLARAVERLTDEPPRTSRR
ncbi:hypothetical protein [Hyalangium sp.]|uniref:hypothetical protein n=1 Tax=Hyalangium sp. TaxID=2028555 RepID=UPI002D50708F|nr:hypothetical protein [Hyalangium sp.]HYI01551.1 hypothetical protein [Hyalangium sp.]